MRGPCPFPRQQSRSIQGRSFPGTVKPSARGRNRWKTPRPSSILPARTSIAGRRQANLREIVRFARGFGAGRRRGDLAAAAIRRGSSCKRPPSASTATRATRFATNRPRRAAASSARRARHGRRHSRKVPRPASVAWCCGWAWSWGAAGGAFPPLAKLARWFLGGAAGSGRQYISWLHLADAVRIYRAAIDRDDFQGVYVAAAPQPVTNAEFMRALRAALHRPWSPPVPALARARRRLDHGHQRGAGADRPALHPAAANGAGFRVRVCRAWRGAAGVRGKQYR